MQTVGPVIWRDTVKNVKNEKYTQLDLEYGESWKTWKMRHKHFKTLNMVKNIEKREKW